MTTNKWTTKWLFFSVIIVLINLQQIIASDNTHYLPPLECYDPYGRPQVNIYSLIVCYGNLWVNLICFWHRLPHYSLNIDGLSSNQKLFSQGINYSSCEIYVQFIIFSQLNSKLEEKKRNVLIWRPFSRDNSAMPTKIIK